MVLAEAMATGIPIITTKAGIAGEWIKDRENGIIVPYQDSAAIFQALVWGFNHPREMRSFGVNAKKLIMENDRNREAGQKTIIYRSLFEKNYQLA
jgi:glycosyltransferase involved in cell wall biosynthesis